MNISWDEYFMGVAMLSAKRSKDPTTQVGCCIVNEDKLIIGIGYNGMPNGDDTLPWGKDSSSGFLNTKYPYVVHAEVNAILNTTSTTKNSTIYVTLFPCNECAKVIVQSKIKELVYMDIKDDLDDVNEASMKILRSGNVKIRKMKKMEVVVNV